MATATRPGPSRRTRALAHIAGQARAYKSQLRQQAEELRADGGTDLDGLIELMGAAERLAGVINELATRALRMEP